MDLDDFFREQERRMNIPDDDLDEYLTRMGVIKKSKEIPNNPVTPTCPSKSLDEPNKPECAGPILPRVNFRAAEKSIDEVHAAEMASSLVKGVRQNADSEVISSPQAALYLENMPIHKDLFSAQDVMEPSTWVSRREEIPDPYRMVSSPPVPISPIRSHADHHIPPTMPKRKASHNESEPSQKKHRTQKRYETPTSSIEEITSSVVSPDYLILSQPPRNTSFRTSPRTNKGNIDLLEEPRPLYKKQIPQVNKSKPLKKPKLVALKLQPVVPSTNKATEQTDPLTSPIEDASDLMLEPDNLKATSSVQMGKTVALQAAPSELYLEVKERIAKHSSLKRREKVINLGAKPARNVPQTNTGITPDETSVVLIPSSSPTHLSSPVPPPSPPAKVNAANQQSTRLAGAKSKPTKGKKKEEPLRLTPREYAQKLQEPGSTTYENVQKKTPVHRFLEGMNIFYTGGDMTYASEQTRRRMEIIVKHGGNLLGTYDASLITHIVTEAQRPATLRALGLKRLSDIPDHVPTVKWDWVVSGFRRVPTLSRDGLKVRMDEVWTHAAFHERIDAGLDDLPYAKGKGKARENEDISRISDFTQDKPRRQSTARSIHDSEDEGEAEAGNSSAGAPMSPPTSPMRPTNLSGAAPSKMDIHVKKQTDDPLAEFYAKARAECESGWARHGEADDSDSTPSDEEEPVSSKVVPKRGWTCDNKEVQRITSVNQDIIDKLQELKDLHQAKPSDDDHWRVFSYSKCIRALRNHPKRIKSFAEARAIRGVGDKTATKIMEILETGALRRIDYERTDDVIATRLFQGIYGVGQSTAFKWYAAGCRTLEDIKAGKGGVKLTPAQEIGIQFYEDINDRMPREEAKAIFDLIKPIALQIDPNLYIEIMGSYRRGKANCGDIDIMITRTPDDGKTHAGVLSQLLQRLHAAGILTEDLALPEDPSDLEAIYRGLCRVSKEGSRRRRIDFLTIPWKSRGAALLYYTGDDIFNRAIRMKAGVLGYSLNQKGLFKGVVRDPRDRRIKMNAGTLVASETEEEIFRILNVPWQEPHERVRG